MPLSNKRMSKYFKPFSPYTIYIITRRILDHSVCGEPSFFNKKKTVVDPSAITNILRMKPEVRFDSPIKAPSEFFKSGDS